MELRQLRYFLAVVRWGSFSAAAERLGRTQQAVSKGVQQLEERLGVRLLDRDARAPRPTAFGELLLEHASEVDALLGRFEAGLSAMRRVGAGPVRIGTGATAASRLVSTAVLDLVREHPAIRCIVRGGIDRELLPDLLRGELDFAVALRNIENSDPQLSAEVLGHETWAIVAGRSHPLASRDTVTPQELAGQRWATGINLSDIDSALRGAFETHDLVLPEPTIESTSVELGRNAVTSGEFLAVLPLSLMETEFAAGRARRLRVPGFEWRTPLTLFRHRATVLTPAALVALDALHRAAARTTAPDLPAAEPATS